MGVGEAAVCEKDALSERLMFPPEAKSLEEGAFSSEREMLTAVFI